MSFLPSTASNDNIHDHDTCPICLELLINPTRTSCNHVFCDMCILRVTRLRSQCPLCRRPLIEISFTGKYGHTSKTLFGLEVAVCMLVGQFHPRKQKFGFLPGNSGFGDIDSMVSRPIVAGIAILHLILIPVWLCNPCLTRNRIGTVLLASLIAGISAQFLDASIREILRLAQAEASILVVAVAIQSLQASGLATIRVFLLLAEHD